MGAAKFYVVDGIRATMTDHARRYGRSPSTIRERMRHNGMSIEQALAAPTGHHNTDLQTARLAEGEDAVQRRNRWLCRSWRATA